MDSDFDIALDGLRGMISNFDFSSFTSKDIVSHKAQHVLAIDLFSKNVQDIEVKFDMTTRQKSAFGPCKQHMLMISLFPIDEVCHFPIRHMEHAIHCKELLGFKYKHMTLLEMSFFI